MPKRKTAERAVCTVCGKNSRGGEVEVEGAKKFLCKKDLAVHKNRQRKLTSAEKLKKEAEEFAAKQAEARAKREAEEKAAAEAAAAKEAAEAAPAEAPVEEVPVAEAPAEEPKKEEAAE